MYTAIGFLLGGILLGRLVRGRALADLLARGITPAILLLLFFLGAAVGGNSQIMADLPRLGGAALLLMLAGVGGSIACVLCLGQCWRRMMAPLTALASVSPPQAPSKDAQDAHPGVGQTAYGASSRQTKNGFEAGGSLGILACFLGGVVLARLALLPGWLLAHDPTLQALWLLMGLVGLSLGADRRLEQILRGLRPVVLLLPLCTMAGTFLGVALASLALSWPLSDCLAVGSGFAYYSLSSVFITQYKGAELGTVALLCNIMREVVTLLGAPLLVRLFGPPAAITCGGCSTTDTTLPVIVRYSGREWVFICIVHAFVLDLSVPFWVTLFCTL